MITNDEKRVLPPYIPWKTFTGFLDRLKTTTVPARIDPSVLGNLSGSMRSQLMTALRFLGLVEGEGHVTPRLRALVQAFGAKDWKDKLSDVVQERYAELIGELDVDSGTSAQLLERFRDAGDVDGQVAEKCVRFYLAALQDAGSTFSPHFMAKRGQRARPKQRKAARAESRSLGSSQEQQAIHSETQVQAGIARFSFPIPGKSSVTMIVPVDLDEPDWDMIDSMLRAYVRRRSTSKQSGNTET